jgi:hypothetical protein
MESLRGKDDDDFGEGDPERLRPSRSLECRPADGGLTSFEKKPGAIYHSALHSGRQSSVARLGILGRLNYKSRIEWSGNGQKKWDVKLVKTRQFVEGRLSVLTRPRVLCESGRGALWRQTVRRPAEVRLLCHGYTDTPLCRRL